MKLDGWSDLAHGLQSIAPSCTLFCLLSKWQMWLLLLLFNHSVMSDSVTPWTALHQAPLSITNSQSLLKLKSIQWVMPSNHLILLPSIFPSIRGLSNESFLCITWSKYWNLVSFSISPSNEYSGFISFRINRFDLLAAQGTLKSFQHLSSKASILQCSAF